MLIKFIQYMQVLCIFFSVNKNKLLKINLFNENILKI